MKTKRLIALAAMMAVCVSALAAKNAPLRVLAIGNSFSEDAVETNLWDIAAADGRTMVIGNLYIGGCPLDKHWRNAEGDVKAYRYRKIAADGTMEEKKGVTLSEALGDEQWDVVTLQQSSGNSGIAETYEPFLGDLIEYVKYRIPKKSRIMFHQTWAYADNATNPNFVKYGCSQKKMYEAIMKVTSDVCQKYGLGIIPCGTAIQNLRKSEVRENVTRDGYHLNYPVGRFTAALTWYEALTGRPVIGNSYTAANAEPWQKQIAQEAAHAAVQTPYESRFVGPKANDTVRDESLVPAYTLPDPLVMADGRKVTTREQWFSERRPELVKLFTEEMYGKAPQPSKDIHYKLVETSSDAVGGKATRKQVTIYLNKSESQAINLLIYLPNNAEGPVPVFMGINFSGNHGVSDDPAILMPDKTALKKYGIIENMERGFASRRWPLDLIISAGYGVVTFYRGDVDPDFFDGNRNGIASLGYKKGQKWPEPDEWGTIAKWAWSLSRALDYAETDPDIDASRVAVIGHSRLGKTSLWAGVTDPRFAIVISNCSGCCGADLFRRGFGESIQDINRHFPHWFCGNFHKYSGMDDKVPFDQNELLSLIAPRPLYVASADGDQWADPKGEFLCAKDASKVYEFLGAKGIQISEWPEAEHPSYDGDVAYHMRHGKHDIVAYDWTNYIAFANKYFKNK